MNLVSITPFLHLNKIGAKVLPLGLNIPTVAEAAQAFGVPLSAGDDLG